MVSSQDGRKRRRESTASEPAASEPAASEPSSSLECAASGSNPDNALPGDIPPSCQENNSEKKYFSAGGIICAYVL